MVGESFLFRGRPVFCNQKTLDKAADARVKFTKSIDLVDYYRRRSCGFRPRENTPAGPCSSSPSTTRKRPLHIRDISKAQDIPQRFLEQILLQLKRAGYLRSRKGPDGGYYPVQASRRDQRGRRHPGDGRSAGPDRLRQRHGPRGLPPRKILRPDVALERGPRCGRRDPGERRPSPTWSRHRPPGDRQQAGPGEMTAREFIFR